MTRWPIPITIALGVLLAACPPPTETDDTDDTDPPTDPFDAFDPADLTDAAAVQSFAENVSAPNMYTFAVLFGAALENGDGICPAASETDGAVTYTGGCTDADGDQWVGSAKVVRTGENAGVITYNGLGRTAQDECSGGGTVTNRQVFDGEIRILADGSFDIDMGGTGTNVDKEACTAQEQDFAMEYAGQQLVQSDSVTQWSGTGRFGTSDRGKVTATTTAEVIDDQGCNYEAESGTTTMVSGDNTVVITYAGAVDCDETSTVTWTLNGTDKGELEGVQCATGMGAAGGGLAAALAGLLLLTRRRRED